MRRKSDQRKRRYSRAYIVKRQRRNLIILGAVVAFVLILWGSVSFSLYRYVTKVDEGVIADGVYLSDVDVSGMNESQATEALEAMLQSYGEAKITLNIEEKRSEDVEVALKELSLSMKNTSKIVTQAVDYGKTGSLWSRYKKLKKLEDTKKVFKPTYSIDKSVFDTFLLENCQEMILLAEDAQLVVENGSIVTIEGTEGVALDYASALQGIEAYLNSNWHGEAFAYVLPVSVAKPGLSGTELAEVQDVLGEFSTDCASGTGRYQNVKTGAQAINGTIVMPGEEISVQAVTSPYTVENGYVDAGAYENGAVVQSIAGGICQVSSTVYNAVLKAELEVTQRQPHSMVVPYVKAAMDAAIAGDYKDLKFSNNKENPIYIFADLTGEVLTVKIYGKDTRPANRTLKFETVVTDTEEPGDAKYITSENDKVGSMYASSGSHQGVTAELWKYVFVDGVEESKEKVNTSYYASSGATMTVGIKTDNSQAASLIKQAVASQDREKIKQAIAEAEALIAAGE